MSDINIKYEFSQFETGLTSFISNFEKKIQNLIPNIPVYVLETGDESYWFKQKFQTKPNEIKENYQSIPRVTLSIEEAVLQTDQDTNQYVKFNYRLDDETFLTQGRRKAINFPFKCNLVCSNFLYALSYFEVLLSILSVDNVFTYEFLGNTYQGSFNASIFSFEKNPMDNGGTKNFVISVAIEVQLQPMIVRFDSIQNVTDNNGLRPIIGLDTHDNLGDNQIDFINPDN